MLKHKKITKGNSITIPKDARAEAGFFAGMAVDMEVRNDEIVLRPHVPVCRLCGNAENVKEIDGLAICKSCATKIYEEAVNNAE
ncbi:MAG: AbrB/MazE/SpoVT family DNA-binding domain-containing protein [Bacillales bacterium]|nr:AbrB/MazE/SpoVT family DNA-binding domain-containing protein [Bacillales bacterium]